MQIKTDENGKIIQTAQAGSIPGGMEIDLSDYIIDSSGNLILNSDKIAQRMADERMEEILRRLGEIDSESIRPLRAVSAETATDEDTQKLSGLEAEAQALREELAVLGGGGDDEDMG